MADLTDKLFILWLHHPRIQGSLAAQLRASWPCTLKVHKWRVPMLAIWRTTTTTTTITTTDYHCNYYCYHHHRHYYFLLTVIFIQLRTEHHCCDDLRFVSLGLKIGTPHELESDVSHRQAAKPITQPPLRHA